MEISPEIRLLTLILLAFLIGIVVVICKPDYRVKDNLYSNSRYLSQTQEENQSADIETDDMSGSIEF
jgi:hypothetical protein